MLVKRVIWLSILVTERSLDVLGCTEGMWVGGVVYGIERVERGR